MTGALGVYRPGRSLLHRLSPGIKLLGLASSVVAMSVCVRSVPATVGAFAAVVVAFAVAGIGPMTAARQLRSMVWALAVVFVFQLVFTDWRRAVAVCGVLLASVALAALVTLTTRTTDMLDSLSQGLAPLRHFGIRTDLIALTLALTIRAIPLMVEVVRAVDEARQARGLRPGPRILIAPVVLAALRTADGFAETLTARGLD